VPNTVPEVAALANHWIARGFTVDLGLAQINSANLSALGLTVEEVLDPQHPSVFAVQRGGSGAMLSMRRAMHRRPLVKSEVFDRASFFG
jgi:type IV secretion system protein VirB1